MIARAGAAWLLGAAICLVECVLAGCGLHDASRDEKRCAFALYERARVGSAPIADYVRRRTALVLMGWDPRPVRFSPAPSDPTAGDAPSAATPAVESAPLVHAQPPPAGASIFAGDAAIVSEDGYLVTAAHCTAPEPLFVCVLTSRGWDCLPARVVWRGSDLDHRPDTDLAVLHIAAESLEAFAWGAVDPGAVGIPVAGCGVDFSLTAGELIAYVPAETAGGSRCEVVRHDMPTGRGDSGGPVVDLAGRLLGVNARLEWAWSGFRTSAVRPDARWLEALIAADREAHRF